MQELMQGDNKLDQKTFRLLQNQDWKAIGKELVAYAERRAWIYKWRDGGNWGLAAGKTVEDLAQDVIVKTIEGVRKWDPDRGPLRPWLRAQLRSVMNHLYHSWSHYYEVAILEGDEDEELSDRVVYHASKVSTLATTGSSSPEEVLLEREAEKEAKERIEQRVNVLFQAVSGEPELEEVFEAIINGCEPKPRHLAAEIDVPVEDIYNRRKRIRRRVSKLIEKEDS